MSEDLDTIAKQIGVLHEKPSDDFMAIANATREARRVLELDSKTEIRTPKTNTVERQPRNRHLGSKALGVAATGIALLTAGNHYLETSGDYALGFGKAPAFEGAQPWTAGEGDGISAAVNEVEGYNSVDSRFITDEIKRTNVDALLDGLQSGETINIPVHVEPNKQINLLDYDIH